MRRDKLLNIMRGVRSSRYTSGNPSRSSMKSESSTAMLEYPILIEPLPQKEGGGFVASVPDLPGCMSDGETPEQAIANVQDAISAWIEAAEAMRRQIPRPSRRLASA